MCDFLTKFFNLQIIDTQLRYKQKDCDKDVMFDYFASYKS